MFAVQAAHPASESRTKKSAWASYVGEANGFAYVPVSADTGRFQQNSTPPHFTKSPIEFLYSKFRGRVINRNSEHIWAPHSPDLTS